MNALFVPKMRRKGVYFEKVEKLQSNLGFDDLNHS